MLRHTLMAVAAAAAFAMPHSAAAQAACGATIYFPSGSTALSPQMQQALQTLMQQNPGAAFNVTGYADPTGSAALNQRLSAARANAVAQYVQRISPSSQVQQAVGAGEVSTTGGAAANAQARRVEIRLPGCNVVARAPTTPGLGALGAAGAVGLAGLAILLIDDSDTSTASGT